MDLKQTRIAGIVMAVAVTFGAFGAHTLKALLTAERLQSWKTAVLYMLIHGLAMLAISLVGNRLSSRNQKVTVLSFRLFLIGILLFSGSIFMLSTQGILNINTKWVGPITPVGGILFIIGWLNLIRLQDSEG